MRQNMSIADAVALTKEAKRHWHYQYHICKDYWAIDAVGQSAAHPHTH
jgi:hypothetical protein